VTRLIYLHGFASGPSSNKAQFFRQKFVERGIEIVIPELDEGNFRGLTITGQLGVLEREAAGAPVALIGSSLGGYLAAVYAARHPEVRRMVLLAPAFDFLARWTARLGGEAMEDWRRTGVLRVPHYGMKTDAVLGYQLIEDGARYEAFPDVRQPALIFHGDQDDVVPVELSRQFVASRPNARLVVLHSGHELTDVLDQLWEGASAFLDES
jgi:pimeloyl-ACP methyl ester carboxylesterase